ncbi:hypothetical protein [Rhodoplanes roseus]|uniref:hypothetical protein n=1 Tax=Rhodoplanes roseus TaxID=29409 RepID=UPI001FE0836A|nr:hypothetical protein [Rhodoplanes roseus]
MTSAVPDTPALPKAVLFDLLTALLDSWTVWNAAAGSEAAGRAWRADYLRRTYGCGAYVAYETLVEEAAAAVGEITQGEAPAGDLPPLPDRDPVSAYRFSIGDVPAAMGFPRTGAAPSGSGWTLLARIHQAEEAEAARAAEPPPVHTVPIDPLSPLKTLTEEEKIALFS